MKIHFKNGNSIEVSNYVVNTLRDNILKGCNDIQFFSNEENVELMVSISEIACID